MLFAYATTLLPEPLLASFFLLAQEEESEKAYNLSWGIVMLCIVLGMMLTLRASKRKPTEAKEPGT